MQIGSGETTYQWNDNWAKTPATESASAGWAHHGVAITEADDIVSYHQQDSTLLLFDRDGNLKRSWPSGLTEGHGITLVKEGDTEYLWIADSGRKRHPRHGYAYPDGDGTPVNGRVVKMSLDGRTVMSLQRPALPVYTQGDYMPTWVTVNEERNGGNGDIWVADGYGASYVHRYDKGGVYIASINGEEGAAGAFKCPHAVFIDTRRPEAELYVADRTNGRIQVYDTLGNFKRVFGSEFLTSPSGFATHNDIMVVAELRARLAILDINDNLVTYLGANLEVCEIEGWPNVRNERGELARPHHLEPGKFNSPHGMAVDAEGNIYVAEWLIGGRFTKLARV